MMGAYDNNTASTMAQQNPTLGEELWFPTNPDERILISTATHYTDTHPDVFESSYREFSAALSRPDPNNHDKAGSLYLNGPCYGKKSKANIPFLRFAVLDADKRFNDKIEEVDGAPDPKVVHAVLKKLGISHMLHTTYSHGSDKGNRYRVVFPTYCESAAHLKAVVTHITELLQRNGVPDFVLSGESTRWGQMWQFPRTPSKDSVFYSACYWGYTLNAGLIEKHYDFTNELNKRLPPQDYQPVSDPGSLFGQVEKYLPLSKQLLEHGYTFCYQGLQTLDDGRQHMVQRWAKPGNDANNPGVVLFEVAGRQYVYSHYDNDPLTIGEAVNSYEAFRILNGLQGQPESMMFELVVARLEDEIVEEMNHRYPMVMISGSDNKIGNIYEEETEGLTYKYMTFASFSMAVANEPPVWTVKPPKNGQVGELTTVPRDVWWRTCPRRKKYNGIRYLPSKMGKPIYRELVGKDNQLYFNLFNGWNVTPMKGNWSFLDWHFRNTVCGGNEEQYEYLLDWFAHLIQKPMHKPGVAIVLRGGKGWGKSAVFSRLIRCLGTNSMVVSNDNQLSGHFNSHLRNKLIVMVEESFFSGDPKAEGVLKTTITDPDTAFEAKGVDVVKGISYLRVIMSTNNEWAAPVSDDERRYFMPTMTSASYDRNAPCVANPRGDFFPALFEEMDKGVVEAFYYDMMRRSIAGRNIHTPPITKELGKQLTHTFAKDQAWLYDLLAMGEIRVKDQVPYVFSESGVVLPMSDLEKALSPYLSQHERQRSLFSRVNSLLDKYLPNSHRIVNTSMGTHIKFFRLDKCRADFQNRSKIDIHWPEMDNTLV
jgi:hypothetical protein